MTIKMELFGEDLKYPDEVIAALIKKVQEQQKQIDNILNRMRYIS